MSKRKNKNRQATVAAPPVEALATRRFLVLGIVTAIGLSVFLAYLPAMEGGFIWDDDAHVTKPELRSLGGLFQIWFDVGATQQYYPLLHSAFWLEHRLWGDSTLGYHLVNVALHVAAASLVYLILTRLRVHGAFLAAAIFALHPVHVESVAWIAEQKNTLSAVFYLSAMLVYLRFDETRERQWYFLTLGLFVLGLLSKTVTATLPAALLVIFWWQRGQLAWRRDIVPLVPFFALGAVAGLFTAWVERKLIGAEGEAFEMTLVERGLLAGRTPWFYLSKLVWPENLVFIYPRWEISPYVWWQWLFPVALIFALIALWAVRQRWRAPLAGVLLFVGTLFPALGFLNVYPFIYSFVADHFQYLASLGIIVLVAAGLSQAIERYLPDRRGLGQAMCVALLFVLGLLTARQCQTYGNIVTLYETTIARNPTCWLAHLNLGTVLMKSNHPQEALDHFERALPLKTDHADIHSNLGILLFQMGRREEGLEHLERAVRLAPESPEAHHDLANALLVLGKPEQAVEHDRKAVELQPNAAQARHGLGIALMHAGQYSEAAQQLERAVELQPKNFQIYDALIKTYVKLDRSSEAVATAEKARTIARSTGEIDWAEQFDAWRIGFRALHADGPVGGQTPSSNQISE